MQFPLSTVFENAQKSLAILNKFGIWANFWQRDLVTLFDLK